MVKVILLTLVSAAVCCFLNASAASVPFGPHRPSSIRSKRASSTPVLESSDKILFPDSAETDTAQPLMLKLDKPPACANGQTYCEAVTEYPMNHVARLLSQGDTSEIEGFFNVDLELTDRIEPGDGERLCIAKDTTVYPQIAKNKDNEWLFIVNQDKYAQGIIVEQCVNPGQECIFASSFPAGYRTECKQQHIYRKLLAVNETKLVTDSFLLPSCCSCLYKPLDLNSRIGITPITPITKKLNSRK